MPICHAHKFIFFHIPRCAGTSIESHYQLQNQSSLFGVQNQGNQVITLHHLTPTDLIKFGWLDHDIYEAYFKFTIIRDPFNRMASDYLWQQQHDRHNIFRDISFVEYLNIAEQVVKHRDYFEKLHFDHFRPMVEYCIGDGELLVDDILLLENIDIEFYRIRDKVGEIKLPKRNASPSYAHLRVAENIDKVYTLYNEDKVLFDKMTALNNHEGIVNSD